MGRVRVVDCDAGMENILPYLGMTLPEILTQKFPLLTMCNFQVSHLLT